MNAIRRNAVLRQMGSEDSLDQQLFHRRVCDVLSEEEFCPEFRDHEAFLRAFRNDTAGHSTAMDFDEAVAMADVRNALRALPHLDVAQQAQELARLERKAARLPAIRWYLQMYRVGAYGTGSHKAEGVSGSPAEAADRRRARLVEARSSVGDLSKAYAQAVEEFVLKARQVSSLAAQTAEPSPGAGVHSWGDLSADPQDQSADGSGLSGTGCGVAVFIVVTLMLIRFLLKVFIY
ncbi:MAG: hypothetical protein JNL58_18785 [Planctomyces sp.]|nr:hypothetical protein [Planctomyces sp.]